MFGLFNTKNIKKEKIKAMLQALTLMAASDRDFDPSEGKFVAEAMGLIRNHFDYQGDIEANFIDGDYDLNKLLNDEDKTLLILLLGGLIVADDKAEYREIMAFKHFIVSMGKNLSEFEDMFVSLFESFDINFAVYNEYEAYALEHGPDAADEEFKGRKRYF